MQYNIPTITNKLEYQEFKFEIQNNKELLSNNLSENEILEYEIGKCILEYYKPKYELYKK